MLLIDNPSPGLSSFPTPGICINSRQRRLGCILIISFTGIMPLIDRLPKPAETVFMKEMKIEIVQAPKSANEPGLHAESAETSGGIDALFEEVDLFSTALIQGGCTDGVTL
ncbi:hypothetical protein ACFYM0_11205 [Streptomyces sp. NPDC006487]|uniref:hypothetical protein n=1 Tax=Streptomyces sp. NPDC006487 TaxID=3364748 RepID=UPI00369CB64B